jgi:phage shock protein PspC (stress-responsive transcriptional regulator)
MNDTAAPPADPHESTLPPPPPPPTGDPTAAAGPWYHVPLARDRDDEVIAGVVGGISRAYGFDVRTTRIAVAIAAIVFPLVLFAYVVAWVLLPDRGEEPRSLHALVTDRRRLPIAIVLGVVGLAIGLGSIGSWFWFGGFPWGVGLIALGVLLWAAPSLRGNGASPASGATGTTGAGMAGTTPGTAAPAGMAPGTPTSPRTASGPIDPRTAATGLMAPGAPVGAGGPGTPGTRRTVVPPPMPATPAPSRRKVPIASLALVVVGLGVLLAAAGEAAGWWQVRALVVVVTASVVMAFATAMSTLVNQQGGLALPTLLWGGLALLLTVTAPNLDGGSGSRTVRPSSSDGSIRERMATGQLTVDLRDLDADSVRTVDPATGLPVVTVDAELGIGRLHVLVPDDANMELDLAVGMGQLEFEGSEIAAGTRHDEQRTVEVDDPELRVELDVRVGMGQVDVERVARDPEGE